MDRPTETEEWLAELVDQWSAVYKKSMTSLVLLRIVRDHGPIGAAEVGAEFASQTDWSVTERGLYRTLRRLTSNGLLEVTEVDAARTGVKRKEHELTELGTAYIHEIEQRLLDKP